LRHGHSTPVHAVTAVHPRRTPAVGSVSDIDPAHPSMSDAASWPARYGAENDVPLQVPNPLLKSSGSMVARIVPSTVAANPLCSAPLKVRGKVLTRSAPG